MGRRQKCDAYKVFETNLERSRAFLRIFDGEEGRTAGQPSNDEKELLRGAVVFAIGALDAFLHDLVLEVVPRFGGNRGALSDALRQISKDDPSLSLRMALVPDPEEKVEEFRLALDQWLERKAFQGPEQVARAMAFVGCGLSWGDLDLAAETDAAVRLEHFTNMRHAIIHRGRRPYVVRAAAGECVDLIADIAGAVNSETVKLYW